MSLDPEIATTPRCPKCDSTNLSITRERSVGWGTMKMPGPLAMHCFNCGKQTFGAETDAWIQGYTSPAPVGTPEPMQHLEMARTTAVVASALAKNLRKDVQAIPKVASLRTEQEQVESMLSRVNSELTLFFGSPSAKRITWILHTMPVFVDKFPARVANLRAKAEAAMQTVQENKFVAVGTSIKARARYTTAAIAEYRAKHPLESASQIAKAMGLPQGTVLTTLGNLTRMASRNNLASVGLGHGSTIRDMRAARAVIRHGTADAFDPETVTRITGHSIHGFRTLRRVC